MTKAKLGSLGLSLLVIILLVIWMATGELKVASDDAPADPEQEQRQPTRVEVETLEATNYQPVLKLQGQLQPWQSVMVGARVAGTVEQLHVQLGDQVKAGEPLLTLSTDGRDAVVERWRANIRKLEADLAGRAGCVRITWLPKPKCCGCRVNWPPPGLNGRWRNWRCNISNRPLPLTR